jgi:transposase
MTPSTPYLAAPTDLAAPAELRERLCALPIKQIVAVCAALSPGSGSSVETTTKTALRVLARRVQYLHTEIAELDARRTVLVKQVAPTCSRPSGWDRTPPRRCW